MKLIPIEKNINLENVKKSNYWDLIAILVWNHYSDVKYQEEDKIEIVESWYGKKKGGSSYNSYWNNPNHTEEGYIRTLGSINITFSRSDFITIITISVSGNISCHGYYTDKNETKSPYYYTAQRNMDKTNWLLQNNFVTIELTKKIK
jgi:hypothetical protein